jgi:hypothetical protein
MQFENLRQKSRGRLFDIVVQSYNYPCNGFVLVVLALSKCASGTTTIPKLPSFLVLYLMWVHHLYPAIVWQVDGVLQLLIPLSTCSEKITAGCGMADQAWRCSCKAWDQACTRCPSAWPTRLFQNHPCKSCCSFFSSYPFLPQVRTSWWARRLYSLSMYASCVPSASLIPSSKRSCSRVDGVLILETLYSCIHIGVWFLEVLFDSLVLL